MFTSFLIALIKAFVFPIQNMEKLDGDVNFAPYRLLLQEFQGDAESERVEE